MEYVLFAGYHVKPFSAIPAEKGSFFGLAAKHVSASAGTCGIPGRELEAGPQFAHFMGKARAARLKTALWAATKNGQYYQRCIGQAGRNQLGMRFFYHIFRFRNQQAFSVHGYQFPGTDSGHVDPQDRIFPPLEKPGMLAFSSCPSSEQILQTDGWKRHISPRGQAMGIESRRKAPGEKGDWMGKGAAPVSMQEQKRHSFAVVCIVQLNLPRTGGRYLPGQSACAVL